MNKKTKNNIITITVLIILSIFYCRIKDKFNKDNSTKTE